MNTQIAQVRNPSLGSLNQTFSGIGSGAEFLGALLSTIVTILLVGGAVFFFFQLLTGAVAWIGSGGDKTKLEEAKQKLANAGIGLVLLMSSWALIIFVENVFGVRILSFDVPSLVGVSGPPPTPCPGCPSSPF
jgi:hypothetical protein